jgi:hypothetical protein
MPVDICLPSAVLTKDAIEQCPRVCLVVFVEFGLPRDFNLALRNNHHVRPGCLESGKGVLGDREGGGLCSQAPLCFLQFKQWQ